MNFVFFKSESTHLKSSREISRALIITRWKLGEIPNQRVSFNQSRAIFFFRVRESRVSDAMFATVALRVGFLFSSLKMGSDIREYFSKLIAVDNGV